jgi:hypothetical protein
VLPHGDKVRYSPEDRTVWPLIWIVRRIKVEAGLESQEHGHNSQDQGKEMSKSPERVSTVKAFITDSSQLSSHSIAAELRRSRRPARRNLRFPLQTAVAFWWVNESEERQHGEGRIRDVSEQGAFVFASIRPTHLGCLLNKL